MIYMIAATIIGAGILALPVYLGEVGFFPGAAMIVLVGVAAIFSALFIGETFLRFKEDLHLPRMAEKLFGLPGVILMLLGIAVYIYGALVGYLSAGGQVLYEISGGRIAVRTGILVYFALGVLLIYLGLRVVKSASFVLFSLMLVLLMGLIGLAFFHLDFGLLQKTEWKMMPMTFGILVFAFTGHAIIPSLAAGARKDALVLKKVCLWGVLLPLIFYLLWFFVLSATIPYGDSPSLPVDPLHSKTLVEARVLGQPATIPLAHLIGGGVLLLAALFTLFSTFTSFLGFGISLRDSYADISRKRLKEDLALFLTVVPPLFLALWHPLSFLEALEFAGLYGGGLFMGILPALMVLKIRKRSERSPEFVAPGGWLAPVVVFLFFLFGLVYNSCL